MNATSLPSSFFDWWFAPWEYADLDEARLPEAASELARRDGYRIWCGQARVQADLPALFDPEWHVACIRDGQTLRHGARLLAGLFAAREHRHDVLEQLPIADRKWCVGIASLQPLRALPVLEDGESGLDVELRGLTELAARLERDFPGVWSRLRTVLPATAGDKVDALLAKVSADVLKEATSVTRLRRCWQMCRQRAAAASASPLPA